MLKHIIKLANGKLWWILLLLVTVFFEASALYYQYVLDEWPCVLCIHIRIWLMGVLLVAIVGLVANYTIWMNRLCHCLSTGMLVGFCERSYQVLAIERGWIFGDCDMDSGLPNWFALDQWFPAIFEVKTSCGYTPYIFLQVSMAEILMVSAVLLLTVSLAFLVTSFMRRN